MATPWPVSLQEFFSQDNFSYTFGNTVLRSDMDTGPQKTRRRFTRAVNTLRASIFLTSAQFNTFSLFYEVTLAGGSLAFTHEHPLKGGDYDFRFLDDPQLTPLGGDNFLLSFSLEELP